MPFTISHAAAVLPLHTLGKSRLPLAALMIGSMSPDFAYFLPDSLAQISSHSFEGILLFCWPVSIALWLLFVHLLELPTIELLPAEWRARVSRSDSTVSLKALAFASITVILGALTHVAWDAFTHGNTPLTRAFPGFRVELFTLYGHRFRVYLILQYLSSVVGLVALAFWAHRLRRSAPAGHAPDAPRSRLSDRARVAAVLLVTATAGVTALLSYASYPGAPFGHRIFQFLIGGMTGWVMAWCAVALFINWRLRPLA